MVGGLSWGYVGPSWGYVGPSWGYVGPSWGHVGPSWGYVGPSWAYVGLSWGYVGPSWGPCWPILGAMLARVRPSWAIRSEKRPKMGRAQNTVKRGGFWRPGVSPAGAAAPLSYGEERTAYGYATARGPLAGLKGCRPCRRPRKVGQSAWSGQAAKQHPIACRNRAQTYPQKLPNVPSEFLEKKNLSPAAVVWWLQAASIRLPERTLRHSKTAPNRVPKRCSNLPTKTAVTSLLNS